MTQAIILAGGLGTRMQSKHPNLPKALIPIAKKPFLQWQLEWLHAFGITNIHLAAGHQANQLEQWIKGKKNISISVEPEPLGTGGGLKFAEPYIEEDVFFVINGDTLVPNLDLDAMEVEPGETSLVVTRVDNASRYGAVTFNLKNEIEAIYEKAKNKASWVDAAFLTHRSIFDQIEPNTFVSTEKEILPKLIKSKKLFALPTEPPLLDMGTKEGFKEMSDFLTTK